MKLEIVKKLGGDSMKQRYALITFFLVLVLYHITRGCPACTFGTQTGLMGGTLRLPKNEIFVQLKNKGIKGVFDFAFTGA